MNLGIHRGHDLLIYSDKDTIIVIAYNSDVTVFQNTPNVPSKPDRLCMAMCQRPAVHHMRRHYSRVGPFYTWALFTCGIVLRLSTVHMWDYSNMGLLYAWILFMVLACVWLPHPIIS